MTKPLIIGQSSPVTSLGVLHRSERSFLQDLALLEDVAQKIDIVKIVRLKEFPDPAIDAYLGKQTAQWKQETHARYCG